METIYLTGYHGVGKTIVGKLIASRKDLKHIDIDNMIADRESKNSEEVISKNGIDYYSGIEKDILNNNVEQGMIVSLPSHVPKDDAGRQFIKTSGRVIYLRARAETILEHIVNDNMKNYNATNNISVFTIEKELEGLRPYYEDLANYIIDIDDKKLNNVFMEALAIYNYANKVKCHIYIK